MNLVCRLPRRSCELMLSGLRTIISLFGPYFKSSAKHPYITHGQLLGEIPKTLTSVLLAFDIEPRVHRYICCPTCFALYPAVKPYPVRCTDKYASDSLECGAKLLRRRNIRGQIDFSPVKTYLHQDFKQWMARFLSRPGIEELIEATTTRARQRSDGDVIHGILEAAGLRNFAGPDGKPFLDAPPGQIRLVWSFSADAFNPFFNREAKQTVSSTGIYLVCNNLPEDVMQRPENMYFVGAAPGPKKPSLTELNHFVDLIVQDFLDFWVPGVTFTRTAKHHDGVHTHAVIVPVICDALGARQAVGLGAVTSKFFCTFCYLPIQNLENFNKESWPPRDLQRHREHARMWLEADAPTREALFKHTGIRWSPFLKLPYFDPIRFTVIDTMHNLYLGLLQRHCRDIWGMNIEFEDGDGVKRPRGSIPLQPSIEDMEEGRVALETGFKTKLRNCSKPVLWYLCEELGLRRGGKKADLVKALLDWVRNSL